MKKDEAKAVYANMGILVRRLIFILIALKQIFRFNILKQVNIAIASCNDSSIIGSRY